MSSVTHHHVPGVLSPTLECLRLRQWGLCKKFSVGIRHWPRHPTQGSPLATDLSPDCLLPLLALTCPSSTSLIPPSGSWSWHPARRGNWRGLSLLVPLLLLLCTGLLDTQNHSPVADVLRNLIFQVKRQMCGEVKQFPPQGPHLVNNRTGMGGQVSNSKDH